MDELLPALPYVEGRVERLVSYGSENFEARSSRFYRRMFGHVAALSKDEWFSIKYRSEEGQLDLRVAISSEEADSEILHRELFDLLASEDSPVIVPRTNLVTMGSARSTQVRGGRRPKLSGAWFVKALRFTDNAKTRSFPIELEAIETGFENLAAAMLAHDGAIIRIMVRQAPGGIEAVRSLMNDRNLKSPRAEDISATVAAEGLPFEVEFLVTLPDPVMPRGLRAAITSLADGLELIKGDADSQELSIALSSGAPLSTPGDGKREILLRAEALSVVRLPATRTSSFPGLDVVPSQLARVGLAARRVPIGSGICIGCALDASGSLRSVAIDPMDLNRHVYVPGQTGSGKSTFLRGLAYEVAAGGGGLLFIDPHGHTVERLVGELPASRAADVVYVDAADIKAPAPINPFAVSDPLQRDTAVENVAAMFQDLFDPDQQGIVGPRWETWFRMGMTTLIDAYGERASLLDVPTLFFDDEFLRICKSRITNSIVSDFWDKEMRKTSAQDKSEILGWFSSKFTAFRMNSVLNAVLGTGCDVLEPSKVMDEGKIVLVSLSKGEIGAPVTQLLGYVYLTRFWTAALRRKSPEAFTVIVDEAQSFTKGSLPAMLSEGRKFGLRVIMANQYLQQLPDTLCGAVLGNVGNVIALRLGADDADRLGARFEPEFEARALRLMPNFAAAASIMANGNMVPAFSLLIDYEERVKWNKREQRSQERSIRQRSSRDLKKAFMEARREAHQLRDALRKENGERMVGPSISTPVFDTSQESTTSTFLDGWLNKKKQRDLEMATEVEGSASAKEDTSAAD